MESQNASAGIKREMCYTVQSPGETFNERQGMCWLLVFKTNMQKDAKGSVGDHGLIGLAKDAKREWEHCQKCTEQTLQRNFFR